MITVLNENKGIAYEAFLLLSLFILMPKEEEKVINVLRTNKRNLNEFIKNFQTDRGKNHLVS
jgi:hypothetical protein